MASRPLSRFAGKGRGENFPILCTFKALRGGKFSLPSIGRREHCARRRRYEAGCFGGGREPRSREAVMAVEFARKLEHPVHRQKIALHHHDARDDHRLAETSDLKLH